MIGHVTLSLQQSRFNKCVVRRSVSHRSLQGQVVPEDREPKHLPRYLSYREGDATLPHMWRDRGESTASILIAIVFSGTIFAQATLAAHNSVLDLRGRPILLKFVPKQHKPIPHPLHSLSHPTRTLPCSTPTATLPAAVLSSSCARIL